MPLATDDVCQMELSGDRVSMGTRRQGESWHELFLLLLPGWPEAALPPKVDGVLLPFNAEQHNGKPKRLANDLAMVECRAVTAAAEYTNDVRENHHGVEEDPQDDTVRIQTRNS